MQKLNNEIIKVSFDLEGGVVPLEIEMRFSDLVNGLIKLERSQLQKLFGYMMQEAIRSNYFDGP